ncbi:hypothetical protein GCM10012275_42950 [Longimycelium tulufanense]|uniref:Uncharacterized protein n=1 Tax=Longimycelium tulufanense TaxID=907463 RepID=A0A8J3CB07_9PSEU|nr:hypothetical protein [Longimycelium tulufanense]GGM67756.1 hypothetical protein GCM10012275_42950 [Longimycelium tulufanense]
MRFFRDALRDPTVVARRLREEAARRRREHDGFTGAAAGVTVDEDHR